MINLLEYHPRQTRKGVYYRYRLVPYVMKPAYAVGLTYPEIPGSIITAVDENTLYLAHVSDDNGCLALSVFAQSYGNNNRN